jgi:hypothetical protein
VVNRTVRLWQTVRLLLTGLSVKLELFTQKLSSNRTVWSGRFLPCNPSAGHIIPPHLFICSHPPKITSPLSFPHLTPQNSLLQKLIFGRIHGPSASIPGHSAIPSCLLGIPSSCPLGIESNLLYFFRISLSFCLGFELGDLLFYQTFGCMLWDTC